MFLLHLITLRSDSSVEKKINDRHYKPYLHEKVESADLVNYTTNRNSSLSFSNTVIHYSFFLGIDCSTKYKNVFFSFKHVKQNNSLHC